MEKFSPAPIEVRTILSNKRDSYRNRIQLHYSARHKLLGFHDPQGRIIPIKNCLIADVLIQKFMQEFTVKWLSIIPKLEPHMGHVEISVRNNQVEVNWNKNYASDGFTQVHSEMNLRMQDQIMNSIQSRFNRPISVLDLFSGNGNLSNRIDCFKRWMVDSTHYQHPDFHQANLFELNELARLKQKLPNKVDVILVDPPRQGFEHMPAWLDQIEANYLIYVSCHYHTMARDLARIKHTLQIQDIFLLDMFPSTHHFESMCIIKLK
jgi:23S rRNA (uracil1939-C5)-methyltransferase